MRRSAIPTGTALTALGAAALLCGCGHSPPTRFFILDPAPPSRPTAAAEPIAPVQLDAVHIPAVLDRLQVVHQTAANRLKLSEQDRWGAPLGELMRQTLAQDLLARLPASSFLLPGAPRPPGARGLVVNILQIQANASGGVSLQASWSLIGPAPGHRVITHNTQLSEPSSGGAADEAAALSRLVGEMADQIAAALAA